ncbi:hypothetical protein Lalb_Chr12g0198631 [Lupinus albus]|uniref:Uncharacterized protein n=1 Tax=Lupinus albus TaxID=3870 RepID=A0A6A4PLE4_LUPAL|nr:hypothetical protein Lalb_Chr12g0198631 [Lupinus albus]
MDGKGNSDRKYIYHLNMAMFSSFLTRQTWISLPPWLKEFKLQPFYTGKMP